MVDWRKALETLQRIGRHEQFVLSALSLLIGVLAGGASILFRYGISAVQTLALGFSSEQVVTFAAEQPWWRILLAPTLGGLAIGLVIHRFLPNRRPQGVADVMEASALRSGRMSLTVGIKVAIINAASLGVGASAGREGPVVHLGAVLGGWIAKHLGVGRRLARTLLGCGVAAAVAAAFNAPIAGVFFALEVVIGHYALSAFAPVVIASVTGTVISRMYYGDFPAFIMPANVGIASFWEFPAFALLGLVSALAAVLFLRSIAFTSEQIGRTRLPPWTHPAVGGLVVGVIALAFPHVLGVGYEATDAALSGLYPLWLLIALIALKTVATGFSLGCGFGGGIFSPSLFLGAMVGGAFGAVATSAFPDLSSGQNAYAVIGMGAVAGAVLGAPISTILMIFELTHDYALTIAVMMAVSISTVVVQQTFGHSYFTWQLEQRGIHIGGGQEQGLLRSMPLSSVIDERFLKIAKQASLTEVRDKLRGAPWGEIFVVDDDGRLVGVVSFAEVSDVIFEETPEEGITAAKLARAYSSVLLRSDNLARALEVYGASGEAHLPVVDSRETMRIVGVAHEHDVLSAYHRAIKEARGEETS